MEIRTATNNGRHGANKLAYLIVHSALLKRPDIISSICVSMPTVMR